jgi:hypothetical protein
VEGSNEAKTETLHQRRITQKATPLTPPLIRLLFLILPTAGTAQRGKPLLTALPTTDPANISNVSRKK